MDTRTRASRIRLIAFDIDGVMTDGGIIPTPDGDFTIGVELEVEADDRHDFVEAMYSRYGTKLICFLSCFLSVFFYFCNNTAGRSHIGYTVNQD